MSEYPDVAHKPSTTYLMSKENWCERYNNRNYIVQAYYDAAVGLSFRGVSSYTFSVFLSGINNNNRYMLTVIPGLASLEVKTKRYNDNMYDGTCARVVVNCSTPLPFTRLCRCFRKIV